MYKQFYFQYISRKQLFTTLFLVVMCWLISGWNTENCDMINYRNSYELFSEDFAYLLNLDFGFRYIEYFFHKTGMTYEEFRIILYGIAMFLVGFLCVRFSVNPVLAMFFYICLRFIRDTVETRNFVASVLLLLSFDFLDDETKKGKIVNGLFLFLAFACHMSYILCIPLIFATSTKKLNYWRFLILCAVLSLASHTLMKVGASFIVFDVSDKVESYLLHSPVWSTALASALAFVNGHTLTHFVNIALVNPDIGNCQFKRTTFKRYGVLINNLNAISCIFIVFSSVNFSFYGRLFLAIAFLNLCFFVNVLHAAKGFRKNIDYLFILGYFVLFTYWLKISPFDYHWNYVMNNNSFFGW